MPIIIVLIILAGVFFTGGAIEKHIQQSQPPTPTPFQEVQVATPSPTLTPTPTPKPVVKVKSATTNLSPTMPPPKPTETDPIVDCLLNLQTGEIAKVEKSFCDSLIDCHLPAPNGQEMVIKASKQRCEDGLRRIEEAKRQAEERKKQYEGMVKCNLSFGDFGVMKKEQCQELVNEQVKKELHEKTLRDAEQLLRQQGLTQDEIDAELYRLDQRMKEQGL